VSNRGFFWLVGFSVGWCVVVALNFLVGCCLGLLVVVFKNQQTKNLKKKYIHTTTKKKKSVFFVLLCLFFFFCVFFLGGGFANRLRNQRWGEMYGTRSRQVALGLGDDGANFIQMITQTWKREWIGGAPGAIELETELRNQTTGFVTVLIGTIVWGNFVLSSSGNCDICGWVTH